ncbi:NnrS family protein [Intrasporangium calvum]|uniref:NnrS family protein n=1 Tax=Intrasporangium calvum TaxID=53358 RepID=A0ABT5GJP7_9MICO|nr:NnrS family protein [Intrasporangium calvum]MDC5697906.1 NnrS family protein [Intrasporangium calvum]
MPPTRGFPAHRPFFLLAQLSAVIGGLVWVLPVGRPVALHVSWLVFGMGGAAVAGYLLTALPSWTGGVRAPASTVWVLVLLWLVVRAAGLGAATGAGFTLASLAFHATLTMVLTRPVVRLRLWHRLPLALAPGALGAAEVAVGAGGHGAHGDGSFAPLAAVLLFAALISLVGGSAIPAFVGAALRSSVATRPTAVVEPALVAGAAVLVLVGAEPGAAVLLLAAALLQALRLRQWSPARVWRHPGAAMMVLAWLWLVLGLVLLGLALLTASASTHEAAAVGTALHALTMGAMGSMIYAFTARATMLRMPGRLVPTRLQQVGFLLVLLSPLPRLIHWPDAPTGNAVAVLAWCLGWLCLLTRTVRLLRDPAPWPALSAAKDEQPGRALTDGP